MKTIYRLLRLSVFLLLTTSPASCTIYNNPTTTLLTSNFKEPVGITPTSAAEPILVKQHAQIEALTEKILPPTMNSKFKPEVIVKKIKVGCDRFILPAMHDEFPMTDQLLVTVKPNDQSALIVLLIDHIQKNHIRFSENSKRLKEAVAQHEKTCKGY